ncbi:MAG: hypothetical protein ACREJD_04375 [Phycisphaerales bacterium]
MKRVTIARIFVLTVLAGAAAFVLAGPLTPPPGSVNSTGKTTQEIYDAVQSTGAAAAGSGRVAAVPGSDMSAGTIDMPIVAGFPKFTAPIVGLTCDLVRGTGSGGGVLPTQLQLFSVQRDIDPMSISPFRALIGQTLLSTVTVNLTNAGGIVSYKLTNATISRVKTDLIQRADGSYAQLETIVFTMQKLDITSPAGTASYSFGVAL